MAEERVYTINLREARETARIERARRAVHILRAYLEHHMKGEVVISPALNDFIWAYGIKKPPARVKVKAVKDGNVVRADLLDQEAPKVRATAKTKKGRIGEKPSDKKAVSEKDAGSTSVKAVEASSVVAPDEKKTVKKEAKPKE
ncbi:MAG: 50S ribosomal protein L31e [Candidatus Aenigmarchaeota archaeon]|nr:50S ribosomal protein L31e [Candidatus Aenigmarchaeota archaeon]